MKPALVLLSAITCLVGAGCGSSSRAAAPAAKSAAKSPSPFLPTPPAGAPRQLMVYGHVMSLTRKGSAFEARVDPAEFLSGETANRAAIEDKVIPPGDVVPNDHYIREDGHRLLTYKIAANAHVTVVTNKGGSALRATTISVSDLAQIVKGKNPKHIPLFEPKNPFWIRVDIDTVLSLDQQYSP